MTEIAIYTEGKLLPPVEEVLTGLLSQFPEVTGVTTWDEATERTLPVLVLGVMPPIEPLRYVKTLSQKQILTNPAAMTELTVALKNLLAPPSYPPMQYKVVEWLNLQQEADLGNILVVDIETGGDMDKLLPTETWLLSCAINDGKNIYVFTEESMKRKSVIDLLIRIFTKKKRKLIAHNMKFDFRILTCELGVQIDGHLDTMLLHHAINLGAKEHGLKELCIKYLGAPDWEHDIKQYLKGKKGNYERIPRDVLYRYNAGDVYWTWHLYRYLSRAAELEERIAGVALHEFRMSRTFTDIESNAVGVNVAYLEELDKEYTAAFEVVLAKIQALAGEQFNPNSPQQVKKFFAEWGITMKSTDEKNLLALKTKTPEVLEFRDLLLEARGVTKMHGTYVKGFQKRMRGNLVYPTFLVHGTTTGRLSSKNPNIQNIPREKKLRKVVVPRAEGRTMVQVDYSQAELRVMACLSGDPHLVAAFQKGQEDFFDAMLQSAFPDADLSTWTAQQRKDNRAKLKGVVYGLAYNRQARAIGVELKMTTKEAQTIINNFLRANPKFAEWRQWVIETVLDDERTLITPFGRQYQAEVITDRNKQNIINSGLAFLPQSTASDMCADAAYYVNGRLKSGQFGDTMIVATIHDAILLDAPDEYAEAASAMVVGEMESSGRRVFGDMVHFGAEASYGASWGECE